MVDGASRGWGGRSGSPRGYHHEMKATSRLGVGGCHIAHPQHEVSAQTPVNRIPLGSRWIGNPGGFIY